MLSVCRFEYAFVPSTLSPYWPLPEKGPTAQTSKIRLLVKTRHLRNKVPRQYLKMVSTSHFWNFQNKRILLPSFDTID